MRIERRKGALLWGRMALSPVAARKRGPSVTARRIDRVTCQRVQTGDCLKGQLS